MPQGHTLTGALRASTRRQIPTHGSPRLTYTAHARRATQPQRVPQGCCEGKHENCLVHAANGDNCALSPLCIGKNQTKRTFEEKKAASAAAGHAARKSGQPSDVDVVSLREMVTPYAALWSSTPLD